MISKRNLERHSKEESNKIDTYLAETIQRFQMALFSADFDNDPRAKNIDIFNLFNKAWKTYSLEWNSKRGKYVFCNPQAFAEFAINQDLTGTEQETKIKITEII